MSAEVVPLLPFKGECWACGQEFDTDDLLAALCPACCTEEGVCGDCGEVFPRRELHAGGFCQPCMETWEFELAGVRGNEGDEGEGCAAYLVALHNERREG